MRSPHLNRDLQIFAPGINGNECIAVTGRMHHPAGVHRRDLNIRRAETGAASQVFLRLVRVFTQNDQALLIPRTIQAYLRRKNLDRAQILADASG